MPHHGEFDSVNTTSFQPHPVLKGLWEEILLTVINVRTPLPRACITELHGLWVAAILIFLPFPLQQKKGKKAAYKSRCHKEEENASYFELRKELLLLLYSLFVYKHQFACGFLFVCLFVCQLLYVGKTYWNGKLLELSGRSKFYRCMLGKGWLHMWWLLCGIWKIEWILFR